MSPSASEKPLRCGALALVAACADHAHPFSGRYEIPRDVLDGGVCRPVIDDDELPRDGHLDSPKLAEDGLEGGTFVVDRHHETELQITNSLVGEPSALVSPRNDATD